jgi:tripartite ATP-independent transporter DctM subunit
MGQIALPELRKHGYSGSFATGTLAAGGTLGILIPPSIILVIYAIQTEQNIARLFIAAMVPGILAAVGYIITIAVMARLRPADAGAPYPRVPYVERFLLLLRIWPVLLVFFLVIGGIYLGWFTPTEAAAVGAAGTGLIALVRRGFTANTFVQSILRVASATAMIFFIVLGAAALNNFLALSQVPQAAVTFVAELGLNPWTVLVLILLLYLFLGCFMDSLSMILLTVPVVWPVVTSLDFGLPPHEFGLWFGILILIVVEVGLITPPVGMNLFIINGMAKGTPLGQTYRGVLPFVVSDVVRTSILVIFPAITLFLVRLLS